MGDDVLPDFGVSVPLRIHDVRPTDEGVEITGEVPPGVIPASPAYLSVHSEPVHGYEASRIFWDGSNSEAPTVLRFDPPGPGSTLEFVASSADPTPVPVTEQRFNPQPKTGSTLEFVHVRGVGAVNTARIGLEDEGFWREYDAAQALAATQAIAALFGVPTWAVQPGARRRDRAALRHPARVDLKHDAPRRSAHRGEYDAERDTAALAYDLSEMFAASAASRRRRRVRQVERDAVRYGKATHQLMAARRTIEELEEARTSLLVSAGAHRNRADRAVRERVEVQGRARTYAQRLIKLHHMLIDIAAAVPLGEEYIRTKLDEALVLVADRSAPVDGGGHGG